MLAGCRSTCLNVVMYLIHCLILMSDTVFVCACAVASTQSDGVDRRTDAYVMAIAGKMEATSMAHGGGKDAGWKPGRSAEGHGFSGWARPHAFEQENCDCMQERSQRYVLLQGRIRVITLMVSPSHLRLCGSIGVVIMPNDLASNPAYRRVSLEAKWCRSEAANMGTSAADENSPKCTCCLFTNQL
jgi:hypothetical protein